MSSLEERRIKNFKSNRHILLGINLPSLALTVGTPIVNYHVLAKPTPIALAITINAGLITLITAVTIGCNEYNLKKEKQNGKTHQKKRN